MTNAIGSHGTMLKIGDGGSPETFATIAEVLDINGPNMTADTEEVTSQSSTWKEYIATVLDAGEVTFDLNFVPTDATHSYSAGLLKDFTSRTLRNFQLVFPDSGSTTWTFAAYVTAFQPSAPVNGKLGASVTLKISGQPTLA